MYFKHWGQEEREAGGRWLSADYLFRHEIWEVKIAEVNWEQRVFYFTFCRELERVYLVGGWARWEGLSDGRGSSITGQWENKNVNKYSLAAALDLLWCRKGLNSPACSTRELNLAGQGDCQRKQHQRAGKVAL